ncbi:WD40/YVTN/BNR-like repeat-containing protein [Ramlibacter tataouinensis]|uniref:WD40/YVTN/BNR-like repeat-containing protein n=1 Tax=Ramlibacter tataouinensis TaxID=94132 RepID=UPI000777DD47|nr:YCF48-related protein [Ramlibacter tataouinensis]
MRNKLTLVQIALWTATLAGSALAEPVFQSPLALPATKSELAIRAPLNAVAMAGPRLVVAGQRGHILHSDDGKTWAQAEVPLSADLTALSFPTPKLGWAVGHEGSVLHTGDGGASWQRQLDGKRIADLLAKHTGQPANPDQPLLDVWFENEKQGFAIGAFNLILRTEDGGKNWTPWLDRVDNPKAMHLYAIRPAGGTLFMVGEQGLVLKLDRERQRFVRVALPYQGTLFGVTGNANMAVVFGLRGNAWRTTDGGASWSKVETGVAAGISGGVARADGSVVLVSQAGQVLLSPDDGATFRRIPLLNPAPVFALADAGKGHVAMAGLGGVRLEELK